MCSTDIAIKDRPTKIMEKVINEQVLHHLESNNLIHDRQYGFRQFRSTGDILAHITHIWNKALETGKETFVIGLDIVDQRKFSISFNFEKH